MAAPGRADPDDVPDDDERRRLEARRELGQVVERAGDRFLLGQGAARDDGSWCRAGEPGSHEPAAEALRAARGP